MFGQATLERILPSISITEKKPKSMYQMLRAEKYDTPEEQFRDILNSNGIRVSTQQEFDFKLSLLVNKYEQEGNINYARRCCSILLHRNPSNLYARLAAIQIQSSGTGERGEESGRHLVNRTEWYQTLERKIKMLLWINPINCYAWTQLGTIIVRLRAKYSDDRRYVLSKRCNQSALAIDPNYTSAMEEILTIELLFNQERKAFYYLKQLIKKSVKIDYFRWAKKIYEKHPSFLNFLLEVSKEVVDLAVPYQLMGILKNKQNRFEESIQLFRKACEVEPGNSRAYLQLGQAIYMDYIIKKQNKQKGQKQTGQSDEIPPGEIISYFQKAVLLDPASHQALNVLGLFLLQYKRLSEAETCFRRLVQIKKYQGKYQQSLADTLSQKRQDEQAIFFYRKAVQLNPRDWKITLKLGQLFYKLEKYEKALHLFKKLLELKIFEIYCFNMIFRCLYKLNRLEEAIQISKEGLNKYPDSYLLYENMGRILKDQKQSKLAADCYQKVLALAQNDNPQLCISLAPIFFFLQRYEKAIVCYQKKIIVDPTNVQAHCRLGICYKQINNNKKAMKYFNQTLQIDPNFIPAIAALRIMKFEQKYFKAGSPLMSKRITQNHHECNNEFDMLYKPLGEKQYLLAARFLLNYLENDSWSLLLLPQLWLQLNNNYSQLYSPQQIQTQLKFYLKIYKSCKRRRKMPKNVNSSKTDRKAHPLKSIEYYQLKKQSEDNSSFCVVSQEANILQDLTVLLKRHEQNGTKPIEKEYYSYLILNRQQELESKSRRMHEFKRHHRQLLIEEKIHFSSVDLLQDFLTHKKQIILLGQESISSQFDIFVSATEENLSGKIFSFVEILERYYFNQRNKNSQDEGSYSNSSNIKSLLTLSESSNSSSFEDDSSSHYRASRHDSSVNPNLSYLIAQSSYFRQLIFKNHAEIIHFLSKNRQSLRFVAQCFFHKRKIIKDNKENYLQFQLEIEKGDSNFIFKDGDDKKYLDRLWGQGPAEVYCWVECLAKGIKELQQLGIIHQDLALRNTIKRSKGDGFIYKIIDFDFAFKVKGQQKCLANLSTKNIVSFLSERSTNDIMGYLFCARQQPDKIQVCNEVKNILAITHNNQDKVQKIIERLVKFGYISHRQQFFELLRKLLGHSSCFLSHEQKIQVYISARNISVESDELNVKGYLLTLDKLRHNLQLDT